MQVSYAHSAPRAVVESWTPRETANPQLAHIMELVAHEFGLTIDQMIKPSRGYDVWKPRMAAMYCARQTTSASLPQLGRAFGGRSHTTVLRAVTRCQELINHDKNWADRMSSLMTLLGEKDVAA